MTPTHETVNCTRAVWCSAYGPVGSQSKLNGLLCPCELMPVYGACVLMICILR